MTLALLTEVKEKMVFLSSFVILSSRVYPLVYTYMAPSAWFV